MLSKEDFLHFILSGPDFSTPSHSSTSLPSLPDGFDGFDDPSPSAALAPSHSPPPHSSFARRLLEASGFGNPDIVACKDVLRGTSSVARALPERVSFWSKTPSRPYQTLLLESDLDHRQLLAIPAFRSRSIEHLDLVEDALARLVSDALDGFQRKDENFTSSTRQGRKNETLCVVSILDGRDGPPSRLVCFGTHSQSNDGGLETFRISENVRSWEPSLAREHLALLYERQFKKLESLRWQDAFTSSSEREQAQILLQTCTHKTPKTSDIQTAILALLESLASNFGLSPDPSTKRRLRAFSLPPDHDIGSNSEDPSSPKNPFSGVTLRDEQGRLLGYIIYPLSSKNDAVQLRSYLAKHNRFHNVLVVYPDHEQATLELWQGREQLLGKLRKGQGYQDAAAVVDLLSRFFVVSKARVRNPTELAQELAYRARYLHRLALKQLADEPTKGPLRTLFSEFKKALIHDRTEDEFASDFAQTLTYGLLTARWILSAQDASTRDRFTRTQAMKKLAIGSRFLSEMFQAVLSMNLDDRSRLLWLVDDIADLLDRIDVIAVFKPDGSDLTSDPVIHFYEPFLQQYDARIRVQRGAYYTPKPVVSYIVRSVHELLQTEFALPDGLADTSTWADMLKKHPTLKLPPLTDSPDEKDTISPNEPFVQILDPATGTGTFLVEVIEIIHRTFLAKWAQQNLSPAQQSDAWNAYVPNHLLPRLYAYELMMAPYAIAHMKVGLKLAETGYRFGTDTLARIFLTNALEPPQKQLTLPTVKALAHEASAVNEVKRYKRFTVVIGNPPYANFGQFNKNPFILGLLEDYKRGLDEKKINLDDDFIKFVRLSQATLEMAEVGILGFITNNVYLDGMTHRRMRQSLLETFHFMWLLDLHGSAKKLETSRDSGKEENVFDIQQGVSVGIFARIPASTEFAATHAELWGTRESKYRTLNSQNSTTTNWSALKPTPPHFFFAPKDFSGGAEYKSFPSLTDAFTIFQNGLKTDRDDLFFDFNRDELDGRIRKFYGKKYDAKFVERFAIHASSSYDIEARRDRTRFAPTKIHQCLYRPFDFRWLYYDPDLTSRPASKVMRHQLSGKNLALVCLRQTRRSEGGTFFVSRNLINKDAVSLFDIGTVFPLFLYDETLTSDTGQKEIGFAHSQSKRPNLAQSFLKTVAVALHLPQKGAHGLPADLAPEDVFHYIYAVFHSPSYRSRYAEFLKIDFPRLPLTGSLEFFRALAKLGGDLVALHLLESPTLGRPITEFTGGSREVTKVSYSDDTVWISESKAKSKTPSVKSGFRGVCKEVWNFHIGGYQVCEKWLKDRKGRTLTDEDIVHYHKIVVALSETIRLMGEIDEVIEEYGGWPGAFTAPQRAEP